MAILSGGAFLFVYPPFRMPFRFLDNYPQLRPSERGVWHLPVMKIIRRIALLTLRINIDTKICLFKYLSLVLDTPCGGRVFAGPPVFVGTVNPVEHCAAWERDRNSLKNLA